MRITILFVLLMTGTGVAAAGAPATRPATTQSTTTKRADTGAAEAFTTFLDASAARDRERLRKLVLLPPDEQRRQWVMDVVAKGELPPPDVKPSSPTVKMDGPVAVAQVAWQMPDGSRETSPPGFLIHRDEGWKVVVDYFEGGGLTEAEMEVINRHLAQP